MNYNILIEDKHKLLPTTKIVDNELKHEVLNDDLNSFAKLKTKIYKIVYDHKKEYKSPKSCGSRLSAILTFILILIALFGIGYYSYEFVSNIYKCSRFSNCFPHNTHTPKYLQINSKEQCRSLISNKCDDPILSVRSGVGNLELIKKIVDNKEFDEYTSPEIINTVTTVWNACINAINENTHSKNVRKIHDILKVLKSSTGIEFSTTKEQRDTKRNGDVPKQIAESVALADKVFGIATLIKSDIVINKEFVSSKTKMDSALSIVTLDSARKLFDLHSKKENMKTVTSQIKTIFTNTSDNDIKRIAEDLIEFDTNLLSFNDDYQKIAKEFTIMETTLTPQVIDFSSYFNRYAIDDSGLKEHMSSDVFKFIIKDTVIFDKLNALFWSGKVKSSTVINYILYKIIDHHLNVKPRSSKECNNVIGEYFPLLVLKAHTFEYPSHLLEDLEEKTSKLADNVIKSAQHLISNINYLDEFKKEEWIQELGGIRVIIGAPRRVLSSYKIFDNYDDLVISSKNSFYDIMLKLRRFKEMRKQKSLYIPQNIDEYLFSFTDVAQGNIHYSEEANILIIPFEVLKFIEINGVKKANIINTLIAKELTKFLITKENFMARNGGTNVYKSKFGKALSCIVEKAKHENIAQTRSISDLEEVTCSIAAIRIAYSAYLTDLVKNPATISRIHGKYGMKNVMNPKIEKNFYLDIKPFLCNINDHQIRNFVDKTIQTFDSYQHAFNCSSPNHVELCHVFPDNHKV